MSSVFFSTDFLVKFPRTLRSFSILSWSTAIPAWLVATSSYITPVMLSWATFSVFSPISTYIKRMFFILPKFFFLNLFQSDLQSETDYQLTTISCCNSSSHFKLQVHCDLFCEFWGGRSLGLKTFWYGVFLFVDDYLITHLSWKIHVRPKR